MKVDQAGLFAPTDPPQSVNCKAAEAKEAGLYKLLNLNRPSLIYLTSSTRRFATFSAEGCNPS
jgi:hypothetical protein